MDGNRLGSVRLVTLLSLLAVTAVAFSLGAGGAGAAKPFDAYAACGGGGEKPDLFCFKGDSATAVFEARNQPRVPFKLCVRYPRGHTECRERRTGAEDRPREVRVKLGNPGRHKIVWFASGHAVERQVLEVQPRTVFVNGDSLAEGTRPYIPSALREWDVEQSVSISRHAPEGVALLRQKGNLATVVVMSLGTNDDPHTVDAFRDAVRDTMDIVGKRRCVVWPNIVRPSVGGASYAGYNGVLHSESKHRRNLRIVDWAEMVSENPGWLAGDGVHVNAEGYQARAKAIAQQVKRC